MKHLVIGCGSIGRRRAKILADLGESVLLSDADDAAVARLAQEDPRLRPWDGTEVDTVLVCTPPETHAPCVIESMVLGLRGLYVEKPIAVRYDDLDSIERLASHVPVTMGACNLRFAAEMEAPMERAHWVARMGQHAKYWSPTHTPISMALDSIHDIDLLEVKAGPITRIIGTSSLDRAVLRTGHENGSVGRVLLDRLTDPPERFLDGRGVAMDVGARRTVRWDLWPPDPTMYEREMKHWVEHVKAGTLTCNPLENAIRLTRLVLRTVVE